jgi:hypothetical protein
MRISIKIGAGVLLLAFGVSSIVLRSIAACNNANGVVYTITDVEIDMTTPDIGAVYENDVCYFKAIITTDNSSVTGGFDYRWYKNNEFVKTGIENTYSTKFSEGEHDLMCLVIGPGSETTVGGCMGTDIEEVIAHISLIMKC